MPVRLFWKIQFSSVLVLGSMTELVGDKKYNTAVVMDPEGHIICAHRKRRDPNVIQ